LPITIIEALSCSLPVISSDVGGCNELVLSGFNGFLVPPKSPSQLAHAIHALCIDETLRLKMASASRLVFDKIFSFERFVSSTLSVYNSLEQ